MKTLILEPEKVSTIMLSQLNGHEILAYSTEKGSICIFTKRQAENYVSTYGFLNLSSPLYDLSFESASLDESIKKAIKQGRKVKVFDNFADFIQASYKGLV